jgi:ketosteroid isomerase-like protein
VINRFPVAALVIASLAAVVAALCSPAAAAPSAAETQIRQLESAVNAAYAANDLATYFTFYADDLRAMYPEGPTTLPAYRADWTAFIKSGGRIVSFKDSDMRIQVGPSGDAAVASYLAAVTTRASDKRQLRSSFSETDVWFKRNNQWKIVEIHYSENPPAPQ